LPLTIEDIAHLSGVSRATVSRVINGSDNVKEATRQRVLKVVQQINFQPNIAARSLAAGHTKMLGLVIPTGVSELFTDPFFPLLIQGVSAGCNAVNYSVMLWLAEPEYERRMMQQILYSGLLDGVVVSATLMNDPIVQTLYENKMPFIQIGRHPSLDVNYVDVDNKQAGREATSHLIHLGRKRIAMIRGPQNMIAGYDRFQGYLQALQDRRIPICQELIADGDFSEESGYTLMLRLLSANPDAVFTANDGMAVGAMRALREKGLRIPEDVSVIGYDDMPFAAKTEPPLTTIRQPKQQLGSVAVNTLIDIIHHPRSQTRHILLETNLVIRSSCGTLKA
jgi:LacI family transcriptional regulator